MKIVGNIFNIRFRLFRDEIDMMLCVKDILILHIYAFDKDKYCMVYRLPNCKEFAEKTFKAKTAGKFLYKVYRLSGINMFNHFDGMDELWYNVCCMILQNQLCYSKV